MASAVSGSSAWLVPATGGASARQSRASRLMAWETGCLGLSSTIGLPWLIDVGTSFDCGIDAGDLEVECLLDLGRAQTDLHVGPVEHRAASCRVGG